MRPAKTFTLEEAKTMATEAMKRINDQLEGSGYSFSIASHPNDAGILCIYLNRPNGERFMFDDITDDGTAPTYMAAYATLTTEEENIKDKGEAYFQDFEKSYHLQMLKGGLS